MIMKPYSTNLVDALPADGMYLDTSVLSNKSYTELLSIIPEGESMYLTLSNNLYEEYVLATNQCGVILLERGIDSEARKFPRGSCVRFETSVPVVKWLVCNYNCCEGEDCPCTEVTAAGYVLPPYTVGAPYAGSFNFAGDTPFTFGVDGLPAWATAVTTATGVNITGTPTGAGSYALAVSATNCYGKATVVQQATLVPVAASAPTAAPLAASVALDTEGLLYEDSPAEADVEVKPAKATRTRKKKAD